MPVHLRPLSRREFLARSLAAGASLALGRSLFAADKPSAPDTWALLADTHIAADRSLVARETNMADNLAAVGRELASLPARPQGVLINGDCAYLRGETGDYATFANLLDPVRAAQLPVRATLGNHDDRANFRQGLAEAKERDEALSDKQVALVRSQRANWFLLDSL